MVWLFSVISMSSCLFTEPECLIDGSSPNPEIVIINSSQDTLSNGSVCVSSMNRCSEKNLHIVPNDSTVIRLSTNGISSEGSFRFTGKIADTDIDRSFGYIAGGCAVGNIFRITLVEADSLIIEQF